MMQGFNFLLSKQACGIKTLGAILFLYSITSFAEQTQAEHEGHHPEIYKQTSTTINKNIQVENSIDDGVNNNSSMGNGPGMGKGMGEKMGGMMEKMGAPKPKDLYPSLMRLSKLTPEKEDEVFIKAVKRMQAGNQLMIAGFSDLAEADSQQDFFKMQASIETIRQGLSQYNSGLSTKRAIAEGQEPRRVALKWFKNQMNLLPTQPNKSQPVLFGMSSFHTGVMLILLLFAVVLIWMYFYKMRRASALLQELAVAPTEKQQVNGSVVTNIQSEIEAEIQPKQPQNEYLEPIKDLVPARKSKSAVYQGEMLVIGIFNETHDVKTFRFSPSTSGPLAFDYEPGQFVTFSLNIPGQPKVVKRSYTIASSPSQRDYFEVTIKREEHGLVSRYMHDSVKIGDFLEIKAPNGKFYFNGNNEESIVLVSGGVGITPMMSAVRFLTARCWKGNIYFLFCTRSSNDFIFEQELRHLQAQHKNLHVLVSMTRAEGTSWMGPQGRFTSQLVNDFVPNIAEKTAHICGPPAMMDGMTNMLIELGMLPDRVKTEAFGGAPKKKNSQQVIDSEQASSKENLTKEHGFEIDFTISNKSTFAKKDESILDVAENLDIDIDSSCRAGSCGSCKVKLLTGQVDMEVDDGLEEHEKKDGYILACQSVPKTSVKIEA